MNDLTVQTEFLTANSMGPIAQKLLATNFNVNALRPQGILRKDEWKLLDDKVVEVARTRLVAVKDLMDYGLSTSIPNALGITQVDYERASDMSAAEVSMNGVTQGNNDRILFDLKSTPLPIIHKDFQINIRALASSRNKGMPLDTMQAALAARLVSEKVEAMVFAGYSAINLGGATIYGYTTATNRNTGSVTATWATATGEQMVTDVLRMIDASTGDNMFGPWGLYVPQAVFNRLGNDYKAASDKTIISRMMEIEGLKFVRPTTNLSGTNIILVQLTSDVVDMLDGLQPTTLQWDEQGGMVTKFKVMAIMAPRIRDDYNSQSGIVHYS